ncbi:Zinc finger, CCHC-type superfamily [Sesbania bispinosa]|nr:Zinc finger, CCHC-type superfamily [Sesbania bispinosa]
MAFIVNSASKNSAPDHNKPIRKERPKCAYCGLLGHTKDKCYKLVGYPPNYNFKSKQSHAANQVLASPDSINQNKSDPLTPTQCQQLITYLTDPLKLDNSADPIPPHVTGSPDNEEDWHR